MFQKAKQFILEALLSSQKYTGTDNIYIAKQGFWASFPYVTSSVLSAGLVVAFANLLPKEVYGTYRYILSAAGVISFLTLSGMNTALTRAVAQGIGGLLAWSIRVQVRFNMLYTVACFIGAGYYWVNSNHTLAIGLLIMGVTFPFNTALTSYGAYLAGKKEFQLASHYAVLSSIFFTALLLGALFVTDDVLILVGAYALGILTPSIFFYLKTVRNDAAQIATLKERQEVLQYSAHLSVVPIISVIAQYLDKILLFQSLGAIQVATYALAQAMPERMKGLAKSASGIILPKLSTRSSPHQRSTFYWRLTLGALLGAFGFAAYWIVAPSVFKILLPSYLDSLFYSQVLMASLIFAVPFNYIGAVFRSQKMLRAIYLSSFVARTPTVILYLVFGITEGIWGMVWANVGGLCITVLGTIVIWEIETRRLLKLEHSKI